MLTPIETILFIFLVFICAVAAYNTWGYMVRIINKGQGKLYFDNPGRRLLIGARALFSQGDIISHRRVVSIFHYFVAYGFIFYGLVTLVEVAEALIPNFHFLENNLIGNFFRLFTDLFTVIVLIGLLFFLVRRFGRKDPVLKARDNVVLNSKARKGGIATDSLIVIVFISLHMIGSLMTSASKIGLESHTDFWQPTANLMANTVMSSWSGSLLLLTMHLGWWISIGLIVLFIPYFPYTKHFHLIMGPVNFMTSPDRTYLGQMLTMDFEDESIEQFGAATLDLTAKNPGSGYLRLHHVQSLSGSLSRLQHGQRTFTSSA